MLHDVFVCLLGQNQYTLTELEDAIADHVIVTMSAGTLISFQALMQEVQDDPDAARIISVTCAIDTETGLLMIDTDREDEAVLIITELSNKLGVPENTRINYGPAKSASFLNWLKHNAGRSAAFAGEIKDLFGPAQGEQEQIVTPMWLGIALATGLFLKFEEGVKGELIEESDVPLNPEQAVSLLRMSTACSMVHDTPEYSDFFALVSADIPSAGLH